MLAFPDDWTVDEAKYREALALTRTDEERKWLDDYRWFSLNYLHVVTADPRHENFVVAGARRLQIQFIRMRIAEVAAQPSSSISCGHPDTGPYREINDDPLGG
ncbi:MAG: hypothetical protein JSS71_04225 [Armatimonadetes bacterium]|nr:hypothetical protein [Armatimonadota bacterium]MBX3108591.1 hypothetical protein [Fimbriimonadaceae bacterium]